ncbi:ABC transporter ATP-binding protein [Gordonibacter sp. 28C]|uniref:ABC transporter ATP-binding protein n=1 Tax=Gordonibacter sp. 28C TaxID=2078569 RepID=UPI000DF8693F|nr:ABC transporter ATP-binding protein [Gordonibacter sp. 28C]RDB60872.1 ABC transporter ATP-binding protein [Gordonibacter sp. 28C]
MLALFKNHKPLFAAAVTLNVLLSALTIGVAFVLERILNAAIGGDWALFNEMIAVTIGYVALVTVAMTASSLADKKLTVRTVQDVRAGLHRGIFSRDTERYRQTNTADYLSALTNDVKIVEENVIVPFLQAIQSFLVFAMAMVALFVYNPLIGGLMIVSLAAMYLLPSSLGRPLGARQDAYSKGLSLFTSKLKDQFAGYEVIRSFRLSDRTKKDFARQNDELADRKYEVERLVACSEGLSQMLGVGSQLGIMLVTAYFVLQGQMAAGALLAILQLSGCLVQPVAVIMQNAPKIQGAKPVLDRIRELSTDQPSAFQGSVEPVFEHRIEFEGVGFGYLPGRSVLDDCNVVFEKGKKYALVGGSGCGKTTLIKLLSAGYGSYAGSISVDGKELRSLDVDKLLALVSVIHQDVYMFDETIKENIDLHRDYREDEWERALSISGVDRFLAQTESGLETRVGENGIGLSGGQRQRVAVARALIERKPILVLDEGTSAVDSRTAYDIETALLGIDDLSIITITHNLAPDLLRRYDAVLYMEQGRIEEVGSYDLLIEKQGGFASFQHIEGA